MQEMINRAKELLSDGTVNRVLGWRRGDMSYNPEPSYFETAEDLDANFVYNGFCGANLSKYMIEGSKLEGQDACLPEALRFLQLQPAHSRAPRRP